MTAPAAIRVALAARDWSDGTVDIKCNDGTRFTGRVTHVGSGYLLIDTPGGPLGFALDLVRDLEIRQPHSKSKEFM